MKAFYELYKDAVKLNASDIHAIFGRPLQYRVNGELRDCCNEILADRDISALVEQITTPPLQKKLKEQLDIDFGFQFAEHERLRVNIHYERGHLSLAARIIQSKIPNFEDLDLGTTEQKLTQLTNGLIIVCGPTGSGKSTTLACMLDRVNADRSGKIITIEDPIEYMFEHKKSVVEQREVGVDTPSFDSALRTIFRQDPDVIMVGEMRDKETVQQTLRIAETGHLVFSTLHTPSAAAAVLRIVDIFEPHEQRQVKLQLAESLRAVIFQRLILSLDGKRIAARELMMNNSAVSNIIRVGNFEQLSTVLQTSSEEGMVTMEKALEKLYKQKKISKEVYDREKLLLKMKYSF